MRTHLFLVFSGFVYFNLIVSCVNNDQNFKDIKQPYPNIIFISIDDLRPELNCYGKKDIISPNINELSNHSFLYENAYCNFPVCGASRASLLTGLRPNNNRFKTYFSRMDEDADEFPSIGEWFKNFGYYTISNGKITHVKDDSPESWSEPSWRPENDWRDYQTRENIEIAKINNGHGPAYEIGNHLVNNYSDFKIINKSIDDLKRLKSLNQHFFLAIGLNKPHLPFNAPKKYWDLYDSSKIKLANNRYKPVNAPNISMHNFAELRKYTNIPKGIEPIPDSIQYKLIHGYYACVSYIDSELGRLFDFMKVNKMYDNSIIIIWGDHGWQLGEHNLWAKHSNFQTSLKVPLIIKYPNQIKGKKIIQPVELLDIYPTLCDLTSLPKPNHLQGKSLYNSNNTNKNNLSFSKYQKGETVSNLNYSYTEWINPKTKNITDTMMFDLNNDPNENINIISKKNHYEIKNQLSQKLDSVRSLN